MNNSKIATENVFLEMEPKIDTGPMLREQATELSQIIEAFENISQSEYWKILQSKVFDGVLESLQRRMRNEKDTKEMFRLQGQIVWAEKYCNFTKLTEAFRTSLSNVNKKLNG